MLIFVGAEVVGQGQVNLACERENSGLLWEGDIFIFIQGSPLKTFFFFFFFRVWLLVGDMDFIISAW